MNRVRIMLNSRKRFVCSAAIAAVFVVLAGGANALAGVAVRCVPSLSVNPACTVAYSTIGAAVGPSVWGDIVIVGPGIYKESVSIPTSGVTVLGAQAGRDARVGRNDPSKESIIDASGTTNGAAFYGGPPTGPVVIDGFTLQGGTGGNCGAGIATWANQTYVLNNIIQNNAVGVFLGESEGSLIEHNLFKTNNEGAPGSEESNAVVTAGYGIAGFTNNGLAIIENAFTGNEAAAIYIPGGPPGGAITGNTSENDGSFVVLTGTNGILINRNRVKSFDQLSGTVEIGTTGASADAAVDIGGGNSNLVIRDNDLEGKEGSSPSNGIAFTTVFGPGSSNYVVVRNNKIKGFPDNGIVAEASSGARTLTEAFITGNEAKDNGADGILIQESTGNIGNILLGNFAEGNQVFDCEDDTALAGGGVFTLGTYNTWFNDIGSLSFPAGICTPPSTMMAPLEQH